MRRKGKGGIKLFIKVEIDGIYASLKCGLLVRRKPLCSLEHEEDVGSWHTMITGRSELRDGWAPGEFGTLYKNQLDPQLPPNCISFILIFTQRHFSFFFHCLLEREEGREKHWCEREALTSCLPHMSRLGIEPTTLQWEDNAPSNWAILARAPLHIFRQL